MGRDSCRIPIVSNSFPQHRLPIVPASNELCICPQARAHVLDHVLCLGRGDVFAVADIRVLAVLLGGACVIVAVVLFDGLYFGCTE